MADSELQAVEAALNTLVLAQTESAFQKVVNRLLPALLSALATKSDAARAKCIQTLHHVNVRIRSHPQIKLPFDQVLQVSIDPKAAILTSNVAIQGGYLGRCFDRLSQSEQARTLSHLVEAADTISSQQNKVALHFLSIRALTAASVEQPKTSGDLLWRQVSSCSTAAIASFYSYTLLALRGKLKASVSEQSLLAVIRLASEYAGLNQPERAAAVFPHFLVAAGNAARSNLVAAGEAAMKRVDTCDVLASVDPSIAGVLFDLFNDTHSEIPLRIVVLSKGLLRVTLCANCFPEVFDVFRHSLFTPGIPPRFQSLGMQFVSFVLAHCDADVLEANTGEFVRLMMKLVNNETEGGPSFTDKVRGFGYIALSELAVHVPSLVRDNTIPPELFFSASQSKQLPPEVRTTASQALSTLARVVRIKIDDATPFRAKVLKTLMETLHDQDEVSLAARAAAVHWANECFLFSDPEARLANIIAAADRSSRVSNLSAAGLNVPVASAKRVPEGISTKGSAYPEFESIVNTYTAYCSAHRPHPASVAVYLQFAMRCLNDMLGPGKKVELLPPGAVDRFLSTRALTMKSMKTLLGTAHEALLGPSSNHHPDLERAAITTVLFASKTSSLGPDVGSTYKNRIGDLLKLIERKSALGDAVLARAISVIIGACIPSLNHSELLETIKLCSEGLEPNESGVTDGKIGEDCRVAKIMATGQVLRSLGSLREHTLDDAQSAQVSEITRHVAKRTMLAIDSSDVVRAAACNALSDIGAERHLPISPADRKKVVSNLTGIVKLTSSSSRVVQAAAQALGKICVGEPRLSFKLKAAEGLLYVCRERKEEDIRFTASESLVRSVSSFDAPSPSVLDRPESDSKKSEGLIDPAALQSVLEMRALGYSVREAIADDGPEEGTSLVFKTVKKIINLITDERPNARAGGCVCLFTFLKLIADTPESVTKAFCTTEDETRFKQIQGELLDLLPDIQKAFTILLSDRSDFVQQLASCGIAFVYNICPPKDQKDLVASLVRSLTTGKKAAATVPGDRGVLLEFGGVDTQDKTGGARSATYKELCNLAQDMGEPALVYKFMDLAGHAALWNSRKGAALAGSALLNNDIAAEQLRPHVKNLLPRLYVYCYDPSESVRTAMGSVISAVVKASGHGSVSEAITVNFHLVTDHCIKSMTSRQWRSREAGCGALRDVLTSRRWEEVKDVIQEFWYITLRAMDDIKESVRKAAQGTGRALSDLSIHLCNPDYAGAENSAQAVVLVLSSLMPAFTHSASEVRTVVSKTLAEIIRHGGTALRSSVPQLMSNLLEAATELDPQILNYAQFHVDSPEELQNARVSAASMSSSSLIDSLERLAGQVDETIAEQVVSSLVRLARIGVGIPTRAATARLFSSILQSRAIVMEPYAGKLMFAAAGSAGMERISMLRKAWSNAAGKAAKLAKVDEVGKYVQQIVKKAKSEDPRDRALASSLAAGLWKMSPDTAQQHASEILPLAYMGRRETDDIAGDASKNWNEVWDEGSPSTQAGLRLYAREIVAICEERLSTSAQYRVKRSAAASLGDLAKASNDTVDVQYLSRSAKALLCVLPGHIWEGQIVVVEAIGSLAEFCSSPNLWDRCNGGENVVKLLLTESHRGKKDYRIAAIQAASKVLSNSRNNISMYEEVRRELSELLESSDPEGAEAMSNISRMVWETGSDADAVDARNKARKAQKQLCKAAIQCLETSLSSAAQSDEQLAHVQDLLGIFERVIQGDWDVRLSTLEALKLVTDRIAGGDMCKTVPAGTKRVVYERIIELSRNGVHEPKYAALKKTGLSILETLTASTDDMDFEHIIGTDTLKHISACREDDEDAGVRSMAKRLCANLEHN